MRGSIRQNNNPNPTQSPNKLRLIGLIATALLSFSIGAFITIVAASGSWPVFALPLYSRISNPTPSQLEAILHYATSKKTPQQSLQEIMQTYNVLRKIGPCNFLIFGLGYDSLMWASFNPNGTTLFLEESTEWIESVLADAPFIRAQTVTYRTELQQAGSLLQTYKKVSECHPSRTFLKGNVKCPLALESLPKEVYETEWDVIMIDAPRGWMPKHPGRMAAVFSAAVMARARTRPGNTHVYLHDVTRPVEKTYAQEFLCEKYKVGGTVRMLWHFEIPSVKNISESTSFC